MELTQLKVMTGAADSVDAFKYLLTLGTFFYNRGMFFERSMPAYSDLLKMLPDP